MTGGAIAKPAVAQPRLRWVNPKLLIAGVVILFAVGFLIYNSMQGSIAAYFVTVGELQQHAAIEQGQRVRVGGEVQPGSIKINGPGKPIDFTITDGTHSIPVIYHGVMPDIFTNNTQVVIEGTYRSNAAFQADTLLTKCPSRFTATQTAQQQ
ncbi:MAG TPA: cytochrome c maturation protein CcmE [Thermomicrobiaceae bacterium]|nr:cytochrome c maturation protein CcmE [Thermomicrobiaceae bacterium]